MAVTIEELKDDRSGLGLHDAEAKGLYSALQRVERRGSHDDIDEVLELADRLINEQGDYSAFGVEPVRDEGAWDSYYTDVVALYVNTGDTYNPTLLYDVEQNEFFVTSWGDWYENYEREKEAAAAPGKDPYDLDDFEASYFEAALWSTTDADTGEPLENDYDVSDVARLMPDWYREQLSDIADFREANEELLNQAGSDEQNGHDFWFTREGHGAGFWDRGYGDVGEQLSKAAKVYGNAGDVLSTDLPDLARQED